MLRIRYRMRHRNLPSAEGSGSGPQGRISKMRKLVTALVRHERIEGKYPWLDESRGYAERLIQEAVKHGDKHKPTMEIADYWLLEKDLVHKLFKVLVPRYQTSPLSFTKMWKLPAEYPGPAYKMAVLELRGNPWPPVVPKVRDPSKSLVNVLLQEAKADYKLEKARKLSQSSAEDTKSETVSDKNIETEAVKTDNVDNLEKELENLEIDSKEPDKSIK